MNEQPSAGEIVLGVALAFLFILSMCRLVSFLVWLNASDEKPDDYDR